MGARSRFLVSAALAVAAILVTTVAAMAADPPSSTCPIRGDIPLAALFATPSEPIRSGRLARQHCEGAYVTLVTVSLTPARERRKPKVHARVTVFLPSGHDKLIEVSYSLLRDEVVLSTGSEEIRGDEGASNAEDGADLWFEAAQAADAKNLILRVELSVTDR